MRRGRHWGSGTEMPRLYRKAKNKRPEVNPAVWRWLRDENPEERYVDGEMSYEIFMLRGEHLDHNGGEGDGLKKLWREVESDVLDYFIEKYPGHRPRVWWWYSAPRIPAGSWERTTGSYLDGKVAEPRLQVSGAGGPPWEMGFNYLPWFEYGIPTSWVCLDPADPPRFESEAAYLRRHGLLLPSEVRRLKPSDFEPVYPWAVPCGDVSC